jgi:urea transport system permease protein
MGVINMAHGEFIMAGAYTAYMLQGWAGEQAVLVALPAAFVVAGAMGLLLERVLFRRSTAGRWTRWWSSAASSRCGGT